MQIDPVVQERIRRLCRQISVSYNLDREIQEELYGHMEDKLLAYMAGEEKLTEDDAFILVREHFGDAKVLQELLQSVHTPRTEEEAGVRVSLPRRLVAALATTIGATFAANAIGLQAAGFLAPGSVWFWFPCAIVMNSAAMVLIWILLIGWQRELMQGRQPWFARWSAWRMWLASAAALLLPFLISRGLALGDAIPSIGATGTGAMLLLVLILQLTQQGTWFWWADRLPRRRVRLQGAFLAVVGLNQYFALFPALGPSLQIYTCQPTFPEIGEWLASGGIFRWGQTWAATKTWWSANHHEAALQMLWSLAIHFTGVVVMTITALLIYLLLRRLYELATVKRAPKEVVA
jgi:hypothetical protein